ncbi:MAG TPA: hypothetical protein DEB40_00590 [Elusimicrobia bacterium]|nr:hypothetical protein [Elusimicrobiota bacterium]HBT60225.1 hypothetical protein [Elusimicrobiota bacterium]
MKVLLFNPGWDGRVSRKGRRINRRWPPLDLLNCAALLEREGMEASIIDARARPVEPEELARVSPGYDRIFVTSSPLDRWQCPNLEFDLFLAGLQPLRHGELYVMGAHGTRYPEIVLERTGAKAVIRGEPEWAVLDICRGRRLPEIPGISYREARGVVSTPDRAPADLTRLPVPAFHLVDLAGYGYELLGERLAVLETTRGCPFPCAFCLRDMYGGKTYRKKTPEQVGREVANAIEAAGARCGYFIDLEFSLDKDFTRQVCAELKPFARRWRWCCQTRADCVDAGLLKAMKEAGCALVHFGVETGSPRIMRQIGKGLELEQIEKGVSLAKDAGLEVACFFMFGFPDETDLDREMTLRFAERLEPTYASFHAVTPYPGTPLSAGSGQDLYPDSLLTGDRREELLRWQRAAYRRHYLRLGFALSLLRRFDAGRLARQARLAWDLF